MRIIVADDHESYAKACAVCSALLHRHSTGQKRSLSNDIYEEPVFGATAVSFLSRVRT
jgi:hypothetical protein